MEYAPHDNCIFIGFGSRIIVGCYPSSGELDLLLKFGVKVFVNLVEETYQIPDYCKLYWLPTKSGRAPVVEYYIPLLSILCDHFIQGDIIYIHCHGGHGRAGTLASLLSCYLNHKLGSGNLDGMMAIDCIWAWRNTRRNTSKNFIPVPETENQVSCVLKAYPVKDMNSSLTDFIRRNPILNRSDKSWLKKVKSDRRKKII